MPFFFFSPFRFDFRVYHFGYNRSVNLRCCQEDAHKYLLRNLTIVEYIFESDVKLSEVVLAHTVLVPAYSFKEQTLNTNDREVERDVPFWIEVLADNGGRLFCVAQCNNQELGSWSMSSKMEQRPGEVYRVTCSALVCCCQIPGLDVSTSANADTSHIDSPSEQ